MQDAFEIVVTDTQGEMVTQPYRPGRTASLNWSERAAGASGAAVVMNHVPEESQDTFEAIVNLSHLPDGQEIIVTARLINNDQDANTSVVIRELSLVSGLDAPPLEYASESAAASSNGPVQVSTLDDVSGSMVASYGRTSYAQDRSQLITELTVTNQGNQAVTGRMIVVLDRFTDLDTAVMHPDGLLPDGRAYFDMTAYVDEVLKPGESTRPRTIRFTNPGDERFGYRLVTLGDLNRAPGGFISDPLQRIEAGSTYRYTAIATDQDAEQVLTYGIVSGPQSMGFDAGTNQLVWQTTPGDVGSHRVVIRATDPFGLFVEQTFDIEVVATLQNRPPNFVTDPVTEAIASSGFEVTTVGVGDSPAAAAVISGFRGPRLVTANSGDQTIGVYAGENNDRFDDAVDYSTGFPVAENEIWDLGYSVDIGLPEFVGSGDSNGVRGLDQGDFNNDGILDLIAFYHHDSSRGQRYQMKMSLMLGDGDGQFGEPTEIYQHDIGTSSYRFRNLIAKDLNQDGNLDVVGVMRSRDPRIITLLGNGDGTFSAPIEQVFEDTVSDFITADINEDGIPDLIGRTAVLGFGATYTLAWLPGEGDGTFGEPIDIGPGGTDANCCYQIHQRPYDVADFNQDGHLDFVSMGTGTTFAGVQIFHGDGTGAFTLATEFDPPGGNDNLDMILAGDFNGNGLIDFVYAEGDELHFLAADDDSGTSYTYSEQNVPTDDFVFNTAGEGDPIDIDGDGDLDFVFGNWSPRVSLKVAQNDGSGQFSITEYVALDFSGDIKPYDYANSVQGGLVGDYNRDGVMDVAYLTNGDDFDGVGIRLGTRPGEFGRTRTVPWERTARVQVAHPGDFNGDGILDLLDTSSDVTALGNGDGSFDDLIPASGVRRPGAMAAIADFDLDGIDDVVARREGGLYVGLSNSDGTFATKQLIDGGGFYGYNSIEPVDLNDDGYPDFVVKVEIGETFEAYLNDPNDPGTFTMSFTYALADGSQGTNVSRWEESWEVDDFTGDGIPDLVTAEREGTLPINVVVFAGDGNGSFTRYSEYAGYEEERQTGIYGYSVNPGDFSKGDIDEDGDLDLISYSTKGGRVFINDGTGNFQFNGTLIPFTGDSQRGPDSWLVDFDEDGHLDFITTSVPDSRGSFHFWQGDGEGNFLKGQGMKMHGDLEGIRNPFFDWDNDGHLDFVYATGDISSEELSLNMGRRDDLVDLITVDLNGDGNEEVIAVQEQMDRLQIFVGDNLGGLTRQSDLQTERAPQAVAVGDLNGDGIEFVVANRASSSVTVFTGSLDAGYVAHEVDVPGRPSDVVLADHNGDGDIDILVLDEDQNGLHVLTGNNSISMGQVVSVDLGDRPERMVSADATGDGLLDVVITLPESNRIMILPGDGNSFDFAAPIYISLDGSPSDVAVLELNDDGKPDVAVTIPDSNTLDVFYGLGDGQFARPQSIQVGGQPERVTATDADQDGRVDLVVTNTGDATVSVVYNRFDPNEVYRYDADAVDPDGDTLTYAIEDGPGGLIIDPATGELLWAASPDQVGAHEVTLSADDGRGGIATQSFMIEVIPARENAPPLIATTPLPAIGAAEAFSHSVSAIDGDRHPLRYRLLEGPDGASIHPTTGELTWDGRSQGELFGFAGQGGIIRVPIADSLNPESITIEGWYELTATPRFNILFNDQGILITTHETDDSLRVDLALEGENLRFFVPVTPTASQWYHLAFTYDASTGEAKLFVDGKLGGSATASEPKPLDTTPSIVEIGVVNSSTQAIFDNYRIWNYARDEPEIQEGMSRQYDGDPRLVLDYRFEELDTLSVRDSSIYGNTGYRVSSNSVLLSNPGLAETGSFDFVMQVEDGRGGFDLQQFTLEVAPELRGDITGNLFDDLDGDGVRDDGSENPEEPGLEDWHLYLDINGNGFPDPSEVQAMTDASGNYRFDDLLLGDYRVSISPVAGYETPPGFDATVKSKTAAEIDPSLASNHDLAIEQLSLSQIRGQLLTESNQPIPYWKAFADLNQNGIRDADEPVAMSDRFGNYALSDLDAGTYQLLAETPPGWIDASETAGLSVTITSDEVSNGHDFTLRPTNTSVTAGLHFVTQPTSSVVARETYTYASVAFGLDQDVVSYDLSLAPEGMVVDPESGLIAWRPTINQVGEQTVIVRATSGDSIALQEFVVEVTAPNIAPVLTRLPGPLAYLNTPHQFDVVAQDAESEAISYELTGQTHGAGLNRTSGRFTWTPQAIGDFEFEILVTDESGASSQRSFVLTVVDSSPAVELVGLERPRDRFAVGREAVSRIVAMDSLGRSVDWSLNAAPAGATVSADGIFQWTPANDQLGQHELQFIATTADGSAINVDVEVTVVGALVNSAPIITSAPITSAVIGRTYAYDIQTLDPDRDPISFALLDAPAGMSIDPLRGTVRWIPDGDQLGESDVVIRVADIFGDETVQSFKLTARRFGGPPILVSTPETEASVGSAFFYSVQAIDAERDPLSYRLLAAPNGMTISESTGEVTWTPTVDQVGTQSVVIEVSDGAGGASTQAFVVLVSEGIPNLPPTIESEAPRFTAVGSEYRYQLIAVDPEQSPLDYVLAEGPAGMTIDDGGTLTWTPTAGQEGKVIVTIRVIDEGGAAAIESFELDVLAQNLSPTIDSQAPQESTAGAEFKYDVIASDANLDLLTYKLTTSPAEALIDSFGRVRWTPAMNETGDYPFEVLVTDPRGGSATQQFMLSVVEDTEAPLVSLIERPNDGSRNVLPWQGPFVVYAKAIDNVAIASLALTANGQDIALDAAGTATFAFEDWAFTTINATATAIDISGNETTRTITFNYDFPEGWGPGNDDSIPTAVISSPSDSASVTGMVSITGTADHEDFSAYRLSYRHIDESEFTEFVRGETAVQNGELGVWDTSLLINDEYVIRLEVATTEGVANVVEHTVGLGGELKLGNFQLSFTDMVIPVAGIPIEITRIYDTLQADREGDFGYGWRLEYRDTDLRVGLPESGLEDIGIYSALRPGVKVFLNVPGQGRQGFTFNPDIRVLPGWGGNNLVLARPRFTPYPGVTSTLATGTSGYLQVNELGELYAPGGIPYNPASPDFGGAYVVTTRDGITYRIEGATGSLLSATDRNENTLHFSTEGIRYREGAQSITFGRDAQGRIQTITDPRGNTITYRYSGSGDLISVTDRENQTSRYVYEAGQPHYLREVIDPLGRLGTRVEYDESGRLLSQSDEQGELVGYSFDPESLVVETTDAEGRRTILELDSEGKILSTTDARGYTTSRQYDQAGNAVVVIGPEGDVSRRQFDRFGNEMARTDSEGNTVYRTYSASNQVATYTDERGNTIEYTEDEQGNITRIKDSNGAVSHLTYNELGSLTGYENSLGHRHSFGYSEQGWLTSVRAPDGTVTEYGHDESGFQTESRTVAMINGETVIATESVARTANGWVTSQTDTENGVTSFEYDGTGRQTAVTNPLGQTQSFSYENPRSSSPTGIQFANDATQQFQYDRYGLATEFVGASGLTTEVEYDATGNPIRVTRNDSTGETTTSVSEFDGLGRPTRMTDGLGGFVEYTYGSYSHDWVSRVDSDGNVTSRTYDASGNLSSETNPLGLTTRFVTDPFGNLTTITHPDGSVHRKAYDSEGRLILDQRSDGTSHQFGYDSVGQLTHVIDPLGQRTEYEYDGFGNLIVSTDPSGARTRFQYDLAGRLTRRELPSGRVETFQYDAAGNRIGKVDAAGNSIEYIYDAHNQLVEERWSGVSHATATYTQAGSIATQSSDLGDWAFDYNANQQLARVVDAHGHSVDHEYDSLGRKTRTSSDFGSTQYAYDDLGRLTSVTDEEGLSTFYQYDESNNLVEVRLPNGLTEVRVYDKRNRVESVRVTKDGVLLDSYDYEYDSIGRITRVIELEKVSEFRYDAASRLAEEIHRTDSEVRKIRYAYDTAGNRILKSDSTLGDTRYEYGEDNRLERSISPEGVTIYEYDENGNQILVDGPDSRVELVWDERRRLISVRTTDSNDQVSVVDYAYDPNGLLVARTVDGETTEFVWDTTHEHPQIIAEVRPDGEVSTYVYGHERLYANGESGETYYLSDRHSGVRATADGNGVIDQRTSYSGYGEELYLLSEFDSWWMYRNELRDPLTGFDFLRSRHLDTSIGRFVSQDDATVPITEVAQSNRYTYVGNDPVNNADPSGNFAPLVGFAVAVFEVAVAVVAVVKAISTAIAGIELAAAFGSLGASAFAAARNVHHALLGNEIVRWSGTVESETIDLVLIGGSTFDAKLNQSTYRIWDFGVGVGVSEGSGKANMDIWVPEKLEVPGSNPESLTGFFAHSGVSLGVHNPFTIHFGGSATGNIARMGSGVGFIYGAGGAEKDDPSYVGLAVDAGAFGYSKLTSKRKSSSSS
ncbi:MAG: FG-GAP-like repeat-containing protein [Planctomycetota bacterium]